MLQEIKSLKTSLNQDGLTGLYNRAFFDEALAFVLNSYDRKAGLALIMVDIDFFKKINDNYGHAGGDTVLRELGQILIQGVPASMGYPCRFGGEEFAILLPAVEEATTISLAQSIRTTLENRTIETASGQLRCTVSLGYCWASKAQVLPSPTVLFSQADEALYEAKHTGRNRVCGRVFKP